MGDGSWFAVGVGVTVVTLPNSVMVAGASPASMTVTGAFLAMELILDAPLDGLGRISWISRRKSHDLKRAYPSGLGLCCAARPTPIPAPSATARHTTANIASPPILLARPRFFARGL